jgi:undecaprenyl-diphosphatase
LKGLYSLDWLEALILGIVQGATEFLPVSSSAHLVLVAWWLGYDTPPLVYTVVVHLGTTLATLLFFWKDWWSLLQASISALRRREFNLLQNPETRLLVLLIIGTIPAAIIGYLLEGFFEERFSDPAEVSLELLITAGLLVYGEWITAKRHTNASSSTVAIAPTAETISISAAWVIGLAQAFAILPGVSRSGSTIAAGLAYGLDRAEAARFSFLLSTPIILGAGAKKGLDLLTAQDAVPSDMTLALVIGFVVSTVVAYLSIAWLLGIVRRRGYYGFAIYCAVFGLLSFGAVLVRG